MVPGHVGCTSMLVNSRSLAMLVLVLPLSSCMRTASRTTWTPWMFCPAHLLPWARRASLAGRWRARCHARAR